MNSENVIYKPITENNEPRAEYIFHEPNDLILHDVIHSFCRPLF